VYTGACPESGSGVAIGVARTTRGVTMNNVAETTRSSALSNATSYALPMLLAINTFALLALDRLGEIPSWIKSAVAVFLAF
jgi:hypothetical protein